MASSSITLCCLTFTIVLIFSTVSVQGDTCNACNCQFNNIQLLIQLIESKIATAQINESASGVTYTRWGKTSCPSSTGAQLVYSGRAGGSNHRAQGGAAEIICLPDDPDYSNSTLGVSVIESSVVQGVEYELCFGPVANVCDHNAPCSVCYVPTRETTIMIPAKTVCPSSWTKEYSGYLTSMLEVHYRSSYNCLDMTPEAVAGSSANVNPALFYYTTTHCNGLACPPYENNRILSCVVCTK